MNTLQALPARITKLKRRRKLDMNSTQDEEEWNALECCFLFRLLVMNGYDRKRRMHGWHGFVES
jgi:hypothetical protein